MKHYMKKHVRAFEPYHAVHREEGMKLDANENTYPLPQELREHMAKWCMTMPINLYPDTDCMALRKAIGEHYGFSYEQIICGVGSDQLIDCLLRGFIEKGDKVVAPSPSFSMYKLSTSMNEGELIEVPLLEDFSYDEEGMLEATIKHNPKVVFVCTPNNPTGTVMSRQGIVNLIEATDGIVVIDEAYGEFDDQSSIDLIHTYENVVVLRTFSKAYGLAGARVGYGLASTQLITCIEKIKPPYHLNRFTQEIACFVITHTALFRKSIDEIRKSRDEMKLALESLGMTVYDSAANFLWLRCDLQLDEVLASANIYIKKFMYKEHAYYRLSIGTDREIKQVLAYIKEVQDEASTH